MKLLNSKIKKAALALTVSALFIPQNIFASWDSVGIGGHFSNRTIPYAISTDVPAAWKTAAESAAQTWTGNTICSLPRTTPNKVTVYAYNYGYNGTYGQTYVNPGFFVLTFTGGNIQFNTFYDYDSDFKVFIAKHEFGHILSLDDVDHYDTMYDGYSLLNVEEAMAQGELPQVLGADDITGVNTIYADVPN